MASERVLDEAEARWAAALPSLLPEDSEHGFIKRAGLLAATAVFFALGILGWLVPVVTGIPFYLAGLVTLGLAVPSVARSVNRWEERRSPRTRYYLRRIVHRSRLLMRGASSPPPPLPPPSPPPPPELR